MARVTRGTKARSRRKRVLKQTEGFYGARSRIFKKAKEALDRALAYAYQGRKLKKRDMRALWQIRISAAAKTNGLSYSKLIHGLTVKNIELNRKMLADLAVTQTEDFSKLVEFARA